MRPAASATSSEWMGCILTGARRTVSPSVVSSAMPFMNSKNCVAWTMEYGIRGHLVVEVRGHGRFVLVGAIVGMHPT